MLPDSSVFVIIAIVLTLSVVLDRLVFRPVLAVIRQREDAVTSAKKLAETATAEACRATEEFDRKTTAARAEVYRQMDEMRRVALDDRTALMNETRQEADRALATARESLDKDVQKARASLDVEAEALAAEAAGRILGRRPS